MVMKFGYYSKMAIMPGPRISLRSAPETNASCYITLQLVARLSWSFTVSRLPSQDSLRVETVHRLLFVR